jgi:hypothetical protein
MKRIVVLLAGLSTAAIAQSGSQPAGASQSPVGGKGSPDNKMPLSDTMGSSMMDPSTSTPGHSRAGKANQDSQQQAAQHRRADQTPRPQPKF